MLPFFKKAEDQERGADEFHGVGGPLHVSNPVRSPLGDAMVAGRDRGRHPGQPRFQRRPPGRRRLLPDDDHQPPALELGAGLSGPGARPPEPDRRDQGARHPHPVRGRPRGRGRIPHAGRAARPPGRDGEIIVSGGVYGSPQLLQLSGLGPGELLQRVRHPGGARHGGGRQEPARPLQHLSGVPLLAEGDASTTWRRARLLKLKAGGAIRRQPLRPSVECRASMPAPSSAATRGSNSPICRSTCSAGARSSGCAPASSRTRSRPLPSARCICAPRAAARCGSRAPTRWRRRRSSFNFLASDYDFQALIYGMRLSRKIAAQPALKPFVAEEVMPGAAVPERRPR